MYMYIMKICPCNKITCLPDATGTCFIDNFTYILGIGIGMTSLTLFSTAEMSDDCVSKFASLVRSRD